MICSCCGVDKPKTDFYKRGRQCKKCIIAKVKIRTEANKDHIKEYHHQHYIKNIDKSKKRMADYRDRINGLKSPCAKCGESRPWVIDFHHINPADKEFNIPRKTAVADFDKVKEEAKKCVCLCRNCHMEFHYFYGIKPKKPIEALNNYLGGINETI